VDDNGTVVCDVNCDGCHRDETTGSVLILTNAAMPAHQYVIWWAGSIHLSAGSSAVGSGATDYTLDTALRMMCRCVTCRPPSVWVCVCADVTHVDGRCDAIPRD
jgi:hypothetical protein